MFYEIGDLCVYLLFDVVCDFIEVCLCQVGFDWVVVEGVCGLLFIDWYKVSVIYLDGFCCIVSCLIVGIDVLKKVEWVSQVIIVRIEEIFVECGWEFYCEVNVELFGSEVIYGFYG